jgi:hypothetical protein
VVLDVRRDRVLPVARLPPRADPVEEALGVHVRLVREGSAGAEKQEQVRRRERDDEAIVLELVLLPLLKQLHLA